MPLYEFICPSCKEVQEALQSYDSEPPKCSCTETPQVTERMVSLGSFSLKGIGWYVTDYARKK